jgi:myo-inositol-1(or 4)-monophosphatase
MNQAGDAVALTTRFLAAQAIAREAGELALRYRAAPETLDIAFKGPQDFVTEADRAVERLITARLRAAFPGDAILGEEYGSSGSLKDAPVIWAIDPIDGTANFAAGRPDWCVSIGALVGGYPTLGVIHQPVLDDLYAARAGQGATRNGMPIAVRHCSDRAESTVCFEYSVGTDIDRYLALLDPHLRVGGEFRRNGSAAVSLAQIAAGVLDGFVELHLNLYDVLAGIVLVREAGGWTNDFIRLDALNEPNLMIAAVPGIRDALLATCSLQA